MTEPQIYRLILALSIVIAYLPVYRFRNSKYFYYFLILSLIDPIFTVLKWMFEIEYYNYFPISTLFILYALPTKEKKYKVLATILVLILLPRLGEQPFLELIVTILISSYMTYYFISDFTSELIKKNTISIFLFFIIVYSIRNIFLIYIYYEHTTLLVSLFIPLVVFYFILFILITIVGPDGKIVVDSKEGVKLLNKFNLRFEKENVYIENEKETITNFDKLTKKELIILSELSHGVDMKEIAYKQSVNTKTIYSHCKNIRLKLKIKDVNDLVLFAAENNRKIEEMLNNTDEHL